MDDHLFYSWLPYLYQYGLGAVIFAVGLLVTLRSGSFDVRRKVHRRWLIVLVLGFVWFLALHGCLTLAALGHERPALLCGGAVLLVSVVIGAEADRRARRRA